MKQRDGSIELGELCKDIKCVVWDLDGTLWNGILLEDTAISLRPEILAAIRELDGRGILQSIASRNDYDQAMTLLERLGLNHFFLYPRINWGAKSSSIQAIAEDLCIQLDTFAFVDDQEFERDEVLSRHSEVFCIHPDDISSMLALPRLNPRFLTDDSRMRRLRYLDDLKRRRAEQEFEGPAEEFLAGLQMVFHIARAQVRDLQRAEELTVRTNQLNTTGYTYSYEELSALVHSGHHLVLVAGLNDKYGNYGKIGLALVERSTKIWTIKLLIMSCRVVSRGVGAILMHYIMVLARNANVRLQAEFVPNAVNRMMYTTYRFGGFVEVGQRGACLLLEHNRGVIPPFPNHVVVRIDD